MCTTTKLGWRQFWCMLYKNDCWAAIPDPKWTTNVHVPYERKINMLLSTDNNFMICLFDFERFSIGSQFPFFFNSHCILGGPIKRNSILSMWMQWVVWVDEASSLEKNDTKISNAHFVRQCRVVDIQISPFSAKTRSEFLLFRLAIAVSSNFYTSEILMYRMLYINWITAHNYGKLKCHSFTSSLS